MPSALVTGEKMGRQAPKFRDRSFANALVDRAHGCGGRVVHPVDSRELAVRDLSPGLSP
jgi:hypothetical protein